MCYVHRLLAEDILIGVLICAGKSVHPEQRNGLNGFGAFLSMSSKVYLSMTTRSQYSLASAKAILGDSVAIPISPKTSPGPSLLKIVFHCQ